MWVVEGKEGDKERDEGEGGREGMGERARGGYGVTCTDSEVSRFGDPT